ncbi:MULTISPECIES: UxaA family hydrolase [unclassified Cryobacterium]|uniref:UxaA family hydrolase n=1 Tax=unclassified Cryobacterium TaxID=2649013 RepID=UPI00106AF352|nr:MULTISPECIES: altronate dehydratase family protein [unclassified Cryobacterium]TFB99231.1 altronate dehydratase [Cryobacterium sp. MDB2-A-1]TFC06687.1 altronate dehydratase [Cryobacterium sp. MDB2-33-2]TFC13940.1 altronate dehydratase [Cryobacterium sp. MDB2-10]TFC15850.1 altronate dehydratase [Cryobacterium sp. MDB2-A-2]
MSHINSIATGTSVLVMAEGDDVAVALRDLVPGEAITLGDSVLNVIGAVPSGHKIALGSVAVGEKVLKYGQSIGTATAPIVRGEHVHSQNLGMDLGARVHEFGTVHTELAAPTGARRTFDGYRRADGRAGTRNYIAILTTVNCSGTTAKLIADRFRGDLLDRFPHVDGVIALTHQSGCGLVLESEGAQMLVRTLNGYAAHPNISGVLVLSLGCEMTPADVILGQGELPADTLVTTLSIQETGGMRATVAAGVEAILEMAEKLDERRREPIDISELVLGLNCGGSDGYSGITANPALGWASDVLVANGATSVLAETPEIYGAEHLLTARATTREVGLKLIDRINWWEKYIVTGGGTMDNNPSPGNKAGGITTILEKSLGAVAKAGRADLAAVYEYAEPMTTRGLGFMDTPGYDPVSVTGLVAGGATVVVFTTGRGSVFGCKPTPSIKVGTNTALFVRQGDDVDINAGRIADGTARVEEVGAEILDMIIAVASGKQTTSEEFNVGQEEFVPWHIGAVT